MTEPASQIAVIGAAGRFPASPDLARFWANLLAGRNCLTRFDPRDAEPRPGQPDLRDHPGFVPVAGLIENAEGFDHGLFDYANREALLTDPQHRLFLQACWTALEDAQAITDRTRLRTGVFGGTSMSSYLMSAMTANRVPAGVEPLEILVAADKDYLTSRVSYALDLRGPAVTLQSACSTSLLAVHVACQSLLNGECDLALAGGATLLCPQRTGYLYVPGSIRSPDGVCRPFDAAGTGTVFTSGVGVAVLKRLEDALEQGDDIRALVLGSAANNDGAGKVGYTAPSVDGQAAVIAEAMAVAGVDPDHIGYLEAHGTGTELGDPVEVQALRQAFTLAGDHWTPRACALGSVKGNMGHMDSAAGIGGFLKTVLALREGIIPPTINLERVNPALDLDTSPFHLPLSSKPFPADNRTAGVSSFGVGGTNVHVILAPPPPRPSRPASCRVAKPVRLPVSAADGSGLGRQCRALAAALETHTPAPKDIPVWAAALARYRVALPSRTTVDASAGDATALAETLRRQAQALDRRSGTPVLAGKGPARPLCFPLPGQGTHRPGMSRALYETDPVFARHLDRVCVRIRELQAPNPRPRLLAAGEGSDTDRLHRTDWAQMALFAHAWAAASAALDWGLTPSTLLGHSIGEIIAATVAGVFTLDNAIRVVAARGALMAACLPGAMSAVHAPEEEVAALLPRELCIASINGPTSIVVAGPEEALAAFEQRLTDAGLAAQRLHTSHAFHSPAMDSARTGLQAMIREGPTPGAPRWPLISNLTGRFLTPEQARDPAYWGDHLRRTVRFSDGIRTLGADGDPLFLDLGPDGASGSLVRLTLPDAALAAPLPAPPEAPQSLEALAWILGRAPRPPVRIEGTVPRTHPLPTYVFAPHRHWLLDGLEPDTGAPSETCASRSAATAESDGDTPDENDPTQPAERPASLPPPVPPATPVEQLLCAIWAEVLRIRTVGVEDNYFDLGGTSVIALQIAAKAQIHGLSFAPRRMLDHPTVRSLARELPDQASSVTPPGGAQAAQRPERLPLSPWQQRLTTCAYESGVWPPAQHALIASDDRLDAERLEKAVRAVFEAQPVLTAQVDPIGMDLRWEEADERPTCFSLRPIGTTRPAVEAARLARTITPDAGAAAHVTLLRGESGDLVMLALHPLLADAAAIPLLLAELHRSYQHPAAQVPSLAFPERLQRRAPPWPDAPRYPAARRMILRLDPDTSQALTMDLPGRLRVTADTLVARALVHSPLCPTAARYLLLERSSRGDEADIAHLASAQQKLEATPIDALAVLDTAEALTVESRPLVEDWSQALLVRYLGELVPATPPGMRYLAPEPGPNGLVPPANPLGVLCDITAWTTGDRLSLSILLAPSVVAPEPGVCMDALATFAAQVVRLPPSAPTPETFTDHDLSHDELADLINDFGD